MAEAPRLEFAPVNWGATVELDDVKRTISLDPYRRLTLMGE